MVLKLKDFLDLLETVSPVRWAESWDNPGLQVGCPTQEIKKIFSSLDPSLRALMAASKAHAHLLFTHHPLIFKPVSRLQTDTFPGNVITEALKRGIAIVAAHTNLDAAPGGINDTLAGLFGLTHVEVLKPLGSEECAGLGRIGNLSDPISLQDMAGLVRKILGTGDIKVVGERHILIQRLAIVGGSGGSLLSIAREKGADLLLTGDVGHHVALEAESLGIALIDGGHFSSERVAFQIFAGDLGTRLRDEGWEVEIQTDDEEADPMWSYDGS